MGGGGSSSKGPKWFPFSGGRERNPSEKFGPSKVMILESTKWVTDAPEPVERPDDPSTSLHYTFLTSGPARASECGH